MDGESRSVLINSLMIKQMRFKLGSIRSLKFD